MSVDPLAGTVVATEELEPGLLVPGADRGVLFSYRSAGSAGEPRVATASFQAPVRAGQERPVVVFCHGTTGVGEQCSVSRGVGPAIGEFLAPWIALGFALVVVDYAGLGSEGPHAYLNHFGTGRQVVDSVRAVHRLAPDLGVRLDDRWMVFGGSQGGHAALSASLVSTRAPGLELIGTVALCPPTDLGPQFYLAGPWVPWLPVKDLVAYFGYILHGFESADPGGREELDRVLTQRGRDLVDSSPWYHYAELVERTRSWSVGSLLRRPLGKSVVRRLREHSRLPSAVAHLAPVLVGQGRLDPVVPWPLTGRYVRDSRAAGSDIRMRSYWTGHGVHAAARPDALRFASERLRQSRST